MNTLYQASLALLLTLLMSGAVFAADPISKMADTMTNAMNTATDTAQQMTGTAEPAKAAADDAAKKDDAQKASAADEEPDCD